MQAIFESTNPVQVRFTAYANDEVRIKDLIDLLSRWDDVLYSSSVDATNTEDDPLDALHLTEFVVDFMDGEGFRRSFDALVSAGAFAWQPVPQCIEEC